MSEAELEMTGKGPVCVDCRLAQADAAGAGLGTLTIAGAVVLALSFCLNFTTSSSTTVNGVTESHSLMFGPLLGGPLALVLGGLAAAGALRAGSRDRNLAVGAIVAVLGLGQLIRALIAM